MPLLSLQCPRCTHRLEVVPISVARGGGGYRELADFAATGHRCSACGLGVVSGPVVDELMRRLPVGGGMSERDRKPTRLGCPACMGSVDEVLLSWGSSFVEVEQCPRCRTMLLDAGELPRVFQIEHASKA
jgi:hypothetical protein